MNFFSFLHHLISDSVNDPASANWLPNVMDNLVDEKTGKKSFPLKIDSVDAGELRTNHSFIANSFGQYWWSLVEADARSLPETPAFDHDRFCYIENPENPYAHLWLSDLTIDGLTNTQLLEAAEHNETGNGYHSVMRAQLNAYENRKKVTINGNYRIKISLCAADADHPTVPTDKRFDFHHISWPVQDITCEGFFSVTVTPTPQTEPTDGEAGTLAGPFVAFVLRSEKTGSGGKRRMKETMDTMTVICQEGTQLKFVVDRQQLTGRTDLGESLLKRLLNSVKEALESADAGIALTGAINSAFKAHLTGAGDAVDRYIDSSLDKIYGKKPAGGLPSYPSTDYKNKVDQYLFDRLRYALGNATSELYLPWMLLSATPPVEPFKIDHIALEPFTVCNLLFSEVALNEVVITGLSNALLAGEDLTMENDKLHMRIYLSKITDPPEHHGKTPPKPPLGIDAKFHSVAKGVDFDGDFTVRVNASALTGVAVIEVPPGDESIRVTVEQLALSVATLSDVQIAVHLGMLFDDFINEYLNTCDTVLKEILNKLNDGLRENRGAISESLTKTVNQEIKKKLKG